MGRAFPLLVAVQWGVVGTTGMFWKVATELRPAHVLPDGPPQANALLQKLFRAELQVFSPVAVEMPASTFERDGCTAREPFNEPPCQGWGLVVPQLLPLKYCASVGGW